MGLFVVSPEVSIFDAKLCYPGHEKNFPLHRRISASQNRLKIQFLPELNNAFDQSILHVAEGLRGPMAAPAYQVDMILHPTRLTAPTS